MLLLLGLIMCYAEDGVFLTAPGRYGDGSVVAWDVIPSLGLVGVVALPVMCLPALWSRAVVALTAMAWYQVRAKYAGNIGWRQHRCVRTQRGR